MTINDNFNKIINNITAAPVKQNRRQENIGKNGENSTTFADALRKATDSKIGTAASETEAKNVKLNQYQLNTKPGIAVNTRELIFSKHAQQRISQRNIDIEPELMAKINNAAKKAYDKNIKNALILTDGAAFIVNTENNVVVTTMNNSEMRDNIITNIDGTVIL